MLYLCQMKLMSAILAVLMICLSVIPCDDVEGAENCGTETHFHAQSNQDHDGHSESDGCSPFCVCQCCHTPVILSSYFARTSIFLNNTNIKLDHYQSFLPNSIIYAIWHPPKFA